MPDLDALRKLIDALDTELLRLLNERATLAKEIGVIKNRASLPVYSPDRETKLLRSLVERSQGPLRPESIRAIYREIMSASLALEKDIAITCFGSTGSPAHQAALGRFGSSVRYRPCDSVAEVLVLGRQPNKSSGTDRTMIMLRIENKAGALVSALEPFRKLGINLSHFAPRPTPVESQETLFFVEADGHREDLEKTGLLTELAGVCSGLKVLGSYPKP